MLEATVVVIILSVSFITINSELESNISCSVNCMTEHVA